MSMLLSDVIHWYVRSAGLSRLCLCSSAGTWCLRYVPIFNHSFHLNRLVRSHGDITFHANMHPCLAFESTGVPATTARERITPCVGDTGPALRACSASATCIADYFIFPGGSANDELGL